VWAREDAAHAKRLRPPLLLPQLQVLPPLTEGRDLPSLRWKPLARGDAGCGEAHPPDRACRANPRTLLKHTPGVMGSTHEFAWEIRALAGAHAKLGASGGIAP